LSEIALTCGMSDQSHLTRVFRRMVGETPHAWRRSRIAESAAGDFDNAWTKGPPRRSSTRRPCWVR
jgi:AraC-like DNA-binding protein